MKIDPGDGVFDPYRFSHYEFVKELDQTIHEYRFEDGRSVYEYNWEKYPNR